MARPLAASVFSKTPGGVRFQWALDGLAMKCARDASQVVMVAVVAWEDIDDFQSEVVGECDWDGSSPTLRRTLPLPCPLRDGLWCDECVLDDFGAEANRTECYDPRNDNAPAQDWAAFRLTFIRPGYWVRDDASLKGSYGNREYERFCRFSMMPRQRERVVSGFGFEYLPPNKNAEIPTDWVVVPDERNFISDYTYDVSVVWLQVPLGAVPHKTILDCLNTVNSQPTRLVSGGRIWQPGELLFKGLSQPVDLHFSGDNSPETDVGYRWTAQPGRWNNYLARDPATGKRVYLPVRVRKNPSAPPYSDPYDPTDHNALFVPSAAL